MITGKGRFIAHIGQLLAPLPRHCGLVTVGDGHPAALGWLGFVHGHRTRALGVTCFGQTGTVADLYRAAGIDAQAIAAAAQTVAPAKSATAAPTCSARYAIAASARSLAARANRPAIR